MKNRIRLFGIYMPFFILLLIGAITLKTIATIGFFNYQYHYFTNETLPMIADALIASAIVFFIIYIFAVCKSIKLIPSFSSPANYIPSAAVSAALVFMAIHLFRVFLYSAEPITRWLAFVIFIFAVLSIVYFALNTIFIRVISARRANFGLCMIIFLGLYLAYLYFDSSAPINSPIKITDQMAYAFAAVFFLYEIRLSLGREKWKAYIIFGFIAATLAAYSSIPSIITYFVKKEIISNSIYESILTFAILLFILLKLLLTDRLIDKKEAPFIEKLKEAAARREMELNPSSVESEEPTAEEETVEEPDENQISILDIKPSDDTDTYEAESSEDNESPMNISSEEYH